MKAIFAFMLFLIIVSPASALDCDMLNNKELCEEIQNSALSESDKDYLLSDIIADQKNFPAHDFVKDWNLDLDISKKPDDVKVHNKEFIKNAWAKVLTIMPSVKENNFLYHTDKGEVLSAFDYEVKLPTGRERGDCRTRYYLEGNSAKLKVYVNNGYQGSGELVKFTTNRNANIKVVYDIRVKVKVEHYEWKRYCASRDNGECIRYETKCEFASDEHRTDTLKITDKLSGKYYNPKTTANFKIKDKYADITKGTLTAKDYSSLHLSFADAELDKYNYAYSIAWTKDDILTVKADKDKTTKLNNLVYTEDIVKVSNTDRCKLTTYSFFNKMIFPCSLNFKDLGIKLETEKLVYNTDETIKVNIKPSDENFKITYADKTYNAKGTFETKAVYPYNKISLEHNGRMYEEVFHVKNNLVLYVFFSITIFIGINYLIVELLKKYCGVLV